MQAFEGAWRGVFNGEDRKVEVVGGNIVDFHWQKQGRQGQLA